MIIDEILSDIFGSIIGAVIVMIAIAAVIGLATYIYLALSLSSIAKKTNTENSWLAWIPVGQFVLMADIAKMHWWPVLLLFTGFLSVIPVVGTFIMWGAQLVFFVYSIIWLYKICEIRNKPGWWALMVFIPGLGWIWGAILIGILAWGK